MCETTYAMNVILPIIFQFDKSLCSWIVLFSSNPQGSQPDPTLQGPTSSLFENHSLIRLCGTMSFIFLDHMGQWRIPQLFFHSLRYCPYYYYCKASSFIVHHYFHMPQC